MRKIPRFISKQTSRLFSAEKLFKSNAPVFLPFYHVVGDKKLPHILNYPYLNSKEFEKELDFFLKYFKPVSLEYLYKNRVTKEKVFHVNFDDGLRECAEIIAPVLIRKGIPATFFINSGFVDNKALFHRYKASLILNELENNPCFEAEVFLEENGLNRQNILQSDFLENDKLDEAAEMMNLDFSAFLEQQKPYLTTNQVKDLHKQGFSIGGHSHKHPEFWKISEKKQFKQVEKSMKWITENINQEIKAFSFPFTDDQISGRLIKRLTEENICDITFGTAGLKHDSIETHLQRYPAEQPGNFAANLKSEFTYYKLRKLIGKATVKH
ncbi:MAG: polysaccharide deacetylase family protein [Bacteroidota bacterium]